MRTSLFLKIRLLILISLLFQNQLFSQKQLTAEDYDRAAQFLSVNTEPLVLNTRIRPNWIDNERFWFRKESGEGYSFVLVNARSQKTEPAFDHEKIASSLSKWAGEEYMANKLPFGGIEFLEDGKMVAFRVKNKTYICDAINGGCQEGKLHPYRDRMAIESPDGKYAAFIRDYNLWKRNLTTGKETQLTFDGEEDFGYATNNAGWIKSDRPVLTWSPDSRMIATFQHDGRGVGEMYMVTTNVGHPKLHAWKYPLPEDTVIFRVHRVVIHVDQPKVVRLQMKPDQHRSSITDHISLRDGSVSDLEWTEDATMLAFASISRDHKDITLRVADPNTGKVRDILSEREETFFESGHRMVNWHILKDRKEVLWYSKRSNWGHLYIYDLETGDLKKQITAGDWNVLQVLHVNQKSGEILFTGGGKEAGDPYYNYLYSVNINKSRPSEADPGSADVKLLSPENANHNISLSADGKYFVDSYSTPQTPPTTVLRSVTGKPPVKLADADISGLLKTGWNPPESFTVKARDGETDLYGLMFKPTDFDPAQKYPIINYIYPGPQSGSVRSRSFITAHSDNQAIAELGFIVIALDAMGTPGRSKSFHDAYYGNMGDNGLPDQITGMKQLADRHAWIDIDKVGIYGHSGGGFASTDAILRYPDFFKVAVSGAGNHDNRNYEDDWGEKWQGLLKTRPDGSTNYDNQANHLLAKNLKGKLLITHGTLDGNVPVYNTLLVVDALIAENKDFDMILFPNRGHGFGNEAYMMRKRWDYFVEHLMGAEPPKEYALKTR